MTRLARAVFVLLVGATFSAFFVAQELKSRPAVVDVNRLTKFFSPNGDGVRDVNEISFAVREADDATVSIVDADGGEVRRLLTAAPVQPFRPVRATWDGRTDAGDRAPDGTYRLRIGLRRQGRSVIAPGVIVLDTRPPRPSVERSRRQPCAVAQEGGRGPCVVDVGAGPIDVLVKGAGPRSAPSFAVWRTDIEPARQVATFEGERGSRRGRWDGLVDGAPAPPGTYLIAATVSDRAGNPGSSAPGLPTLPLAVRGAPGITVRGLAAQGPTSPVRAGGRVTFFVDARGRAFRWRLRRLGQSRPLKRGRATDARLVMKAPEGRSGLYLLELSTRGFEAAVPLAVQASARAPMLVVLPAMTWLGRARVDDGGDGLPDTLERGVPVATRRMLGPDGALPEGLADGIAPMLVALDRARIPYDMTTDLALARSRDPRASDRDGVLLAGPHRWITRDLGRRLRRYALDGGQVASYGVDTLRAGVTLANGRLLRPTAPTVSDVFGAQLEPVRRWSPPEPGATPPELEPIAGDAGHPLLTAFDGTLAGFRVVEEARNREAGRRRLLAGLGEPLSEAEVADAEGAGEAPREPLPSLAATRVGKGQVIRVGLPGWAQRIAEDPEVAQLQRNIVDILRGVRPKPRSVPRP